MTEQTWWLIGTIVGTHGLKGELKVLPETDFPERLTKAGPRRLQGPDGQHQMVNLLSGRYHASKKQYLIQLKGVDDSDAAEALRGWQFVVSSKERPVLETDEFHVMDLIGLMAYRQDTGAVLGPVVDMNTFGNDILVIQTPKQKLMVPFVKALVPVVDLENKRLEISPIPGLLDDLPEAPES
jgi:16S rRNA processing protein RimM